MAGGIIIGIILAIGAYIMTYNIAGKIRSREKKGQKKACEGPRQAEDRKQKAPTPITAPGEPECVYATSILCQTETKDHKTGPPNLLRRNT